MQKASATVLILIWASLLLWAQARPATARPSHVAVKKPTGSISGRVFLITAGGDLKPARFANVYLMSGTEDKNHESAMKVFLEKQISGEQKNTEDMNSASAANYSEDLGCRKGLLVIIDALQATAKWAENSNKYFASTQTDEEGVFQISGIALDSSGGKSSQSLDAGTASAGRVSSFTLAVLGRAGANDAYWTTDLTFIQSSGTNVAWRVGAGNVNLGRDMSVKLASPEKSCLVVP